MATNTIKFKLQAYKRLSAASHVERTNFKTYSIAVSPRATFRDILHETGLDRFNPQVISWMRGFGCDLVDPATRVLSDGLYNPKSHFYVIRIPEKGIKGYNLAERTLEDALIQFMKNLEARK